MSRQRDAVLLGRELVGLWIRSLAWLLPRTLLGRARVEQLIHRRAPFAYACLHGDSVLLLATHLHEPLAVLVSRSGDGVLAAGLLRRLGLRVASGSSSSRAVTGLRSLARLSGNGARAAITVDGPRGPAGEVAPGILALAQLQDLWIVPVAAACRSGLTLNSWDRVRLPLPWTRVVVAYGRPFRVPRGEALPAHRGQLKQQLQLLRTRASRLCGQSGYQRFTSGGSTQ